MDIDTIKLVSAEIEKTNAGAFFSVDTLTDVSMDKEHKDMQGRVTRKQTGLILQGRTSYAKRMVKADPTFKLSERRWGTRISANLFEHTPAKTKKYTVYLEAMFNTDSSITKARVQYYVDGIETAISDIDGVKKSAYSDAPVAYRMYKSDSVLSVRVNGRVFT